MSSEWVTVPRDPTPEMVLAGRSAGAAEVNKEFHPDNQDPLEAAYRAMLAASPPAPAAEPVAWARRWHVDGETPAKERNSNGRMAWPAKFKMMPVTVTQALPDDVPLGVIAPPPVETSRPAMKTPEEVDAYIAGIEASQQQAGGEGK